MSICCYRVLLLSVSRRGLGALEHIGITHSALTALGG